MTRVGSLPLRFRQGPFSTSDEGLSVHFSACCCFDSHVQRPTSVHVLLIRKGCARSMARTRLRSKSRYGIGIRLRNCAVRPVRAPSG